MSQNNQTRSIAYDNPNAAVRQGAQLAANSAGSGSTSGKFNAWAAMRVWGVHFEVTTPGTSTYTVAGTATAQATQMSAIYITNTNTAGGVTLATTTVGPFTIGGTTTAGTNVNVGGVGGLAGGYQGPYALNTLGGTNTTQAWGTQTFSSAAFPTGAPGVGFGGLPLNVGDVLYFVNGTDATAVIVPTLQVSVDPSANLVS